MQLLIKRNILSTVIGDVALVMSFWMVFLILSWLCFQHSHSSLWLGVLGFCINIPFLLCPFFGVFADKYNKKKLVLIGLGLFLLPVLYLGLAYQYWHLGLTAILVLGLIFGTIFAFLRPAENAMTKEIVATPAQLHTTTALTTSSIKVSQLLAAVLNGILLLGGLAFAILGVPILLVISILAFSLVKLIAYRTTRSQQQTHVGEIGFRQGVCYILGRRGYWSILLVSAIAEMVVVSVLFQLPVFTHQYNEHHAIYVLNAFYLAGGLGGLIGGFIANCILPRSTGLMKAAAFFLMLMAVALVIFALYNNLWIRLLAMLVLDGSWIVVGTKCNVSMQLLVNDTYRGRAMGMLLMGNIGLSPLAILLVGFTSEYLGVFLALISISFILFIVAVWYLRMLPHFRQELSTALL